MTATQVGKIGSEESSKMGMRFEGRGVETHWKFDLNDLFLDVEGVIVWALGDGT